MMQQVESVYRVRVYVYKINDDYDDLTRHIFPRSNSNDVTTSRAYKKMMLGG
jgi:hypothetical protein